MTMKVSWIENELPPELRALICDCPLCRPIRIALARTMLEMDDEARATPPPLALVKQ